MAVVGEVRVWWISTGWRVRDWEVEECRLSGGLVIDAFRRLVDPRSSRKFSMAVSRSLLDDRSSLSGSRWREICFGRRSGLPSIRSPSASIGMAITTFSSLLYSSSG